MINRLKSILIDADMLLKKAFSYIFMILVLSSACNVLNSDDPVDPVPKIIELTPDQAELVQSSNQFGIDLFRNIALAESSNMMISPLSASINLTMLLNGAESETRNQIAAMLGYGLDADLETINGAYKDLVNKLLDADASVRLKIANAIFYDQTFDVKPTYIQRLSDAYDAEVRKLDFANPSSLNIINKWASDKTEKKIPKVLDEIKADHVLFLMNAIYYKGNWTKKFDKSNTTLQPFFVDPAQPIQVPTMQGIVTGKIFSGDGFLALELPYGRTNYSMVMMIPVGKSMVDFKESLNGELWHELTSGLNAMQQFGEVDVHLPKFSFEYEIQLNEILNSMGMIDAFSETNADFKQISDQQIFVDFVKQNTFIEVNEDGTEAAAVTTTGISVTSMKPQFKVNKPFVFAIREHYTNTVMFIGQVTNPNE